MSHVKNVTVPWVPLAEFDWSFGRSGPLPWNLTVWAILAVFTALPIWTTVELTAWVFYTFTRYDTLYFWSVLITTWGVTIHAIGFVLKFCVPQCNWIISTILAEIGWVSMVSGFSVVLYSRLHLVVPRASKLMQWVLGMIITDAFLFHVPTIVFQFLVSNKATHKRFLPYMDPMERVQVLGFSIQETIISVIYIYFTIRFLQGHFSKKVRTTMAVLILIQIIVILCDVIVIVLDYCEYFTLKAVLHSFVYGFKLQLEFVILNEFKERASKGGFNSNDFEISSDPPLPTPPSHPEKPSGKRWWSSGRSSPVSNISSTDEIVIARLEDSGSRGSDSVTRVAPQMNGGFITSHPVANSVSTEGRYRDRDVERQYLGSWERRRT